MLHNLRQVLQSNENFLLKEIHKDFKKSEFETQTNELLLLYDELDTAIKKVKSWSARKRVKTNLANFPAKSYVYPEPLGVSLIIGAWNYPYQLSLAPIIPAIAAGNTVILKPSELPSHTSAAMAKIIGENFDPKSLAVIEGGVEETTELLEEKFDKIFFTGSVPVGRIIYQAAAKHLTPVTLELGGKSPAFVTEDCDLNMCVKRLVWGKFLNSGQTCIAPDYILAHKNIKKKLLSLIQAEIERANYAFENDNYIQIINDKNFDRLIELIEGDKIYYGGKSDRTLRYIQPTILNNVTFDDKVMKDEIFGPILPVIEYEDLNSAIQKVKELPRPLSLYIFTKNDKIREKILHEISFGGGAVNDTIMHISNPNLPFGGVGNSGIGNYHHEAGFSTFSHYKSVLIKPNWFELPLKFSPYTKTKLSWIRRIYN